MSPLLRLRPRMVLPQCRPRRRSIPGPGLEGVANENLDLVAVLSPSLQSEAVVSSLVESEH